MAKFISVNLPEFKIVISENGATVKQLTRYAIGRDGHHTPIFANGSLSPTKREAMHKSSEYPPPHGGAEMPYSLFFSAPNSACAFHQGNPAVESHGCIHLPQEDAKWLFDWAGSAPVGVTISGPYPQKHTNP